MNCFEFHVKCKNVSFSTSLISSYIVNSWVSSYIVENKLFPSRECPQMTSTGYEKLKTIKQMQQFLRLKCGGWD